LAAVGGDEAVKQVEAAARERHARLVQGLIDDARLVAALLKPHRKPEDKSPSDTLKRVLTDACDLVETLRGLSDQLQPHALSGDEPLGDALRRVLTELEAQRGQPDRA
jgi:hypothetical protein